jgi:hypothetical protein
MLEISGKHPEKTDEELIGQFRDSGSLEILGELYARYMHLVYGVSLKSPGMRFINLRTGSVCLPGTTVLWRSGRGKAWINGWRD